MSTLGRLRAAALHVPGAYEAIQQLSRIGNGKIRRIPVGPLKGVRWRHDESLPLWYRIGLYEPEVATLIHRHLRPGDTFWDIGANAGYHSLVAARELGQLGRVIAVEANPAVADIAQTQFRLNREGHRVTLVRAAISNAEGTETLTVMPNNRMSAIESVAQHPGTPLQVKATTLDNLAAEWGTPHLIKMDIEGGEALALQGGQHLFSARDRPRILLSVHGSEAEGYCRSRLAAKGYRIESHPEFPQMLVCLPTESGQKGHG